MKVNTKKWLDILFIIYCVFMLWMTILNREPRTHRCELSLFWSFRELIDGHPDGVQDTIQYLENILFFIPFGFLLPWKKSRKQAYLIAFAVSFTIELSQFVYAVGLAETDDVIANVLGGVIGFWLYQIMKRRRETRKGRE